MRVPTRREASRKRRRARIEEHLAVLRVMRARVRRRYAEATVQVVDQVHSARRRLGSEGELASERLVALLERTWRAFRRNREG